MMEILLSEFGANLSASTTSGETVFHLAVRIENVLITQLLVNAFEKQQQQMQQQRQQKQRQCEEEEEEEKSKQPVEEEKSEVAADHAQKNCSQTAKAAASLGQTSTASAEQPSIGSISPASGINSSSSPPLNDASQIGPEDRPATQSKSCLNAVTKSSLNGAASSSASSSSSSSVSSSPLPPAEFATTTIMMTTTTTKPTTTETISSTKFAEKTQNVSNYSKPATPSPTSRSSSPSSSPASSSSSSVSSSSCTSPWELADSAGETPLFVAVRQKSTGMARHLLNKLSGTSRILSPNTCYFLGSGPGRGRSPLEWGYFPFLRPS